MNQLTEEQQERVKQIRERHWLRSKHGTPAYVEAVVDVTTLLSLLDSDSQAAGDCDDMRLYSMLKKAGLLHTCHRPHDPGAALERLARNVADLAATAMRDKCVEKVKAAQRACEQTPASSEDYEYDQVVAWKLAGIVSELESLTLDQVKPEKQ